MYTLLIVCWLAGKEITLTGSYGTYELCELSRRATRDDLQKSGYSIVSQSCKKEVK